MKKKERKTGHNLKNQDGYPKIRKKNQKYHRLNKISIIPPKIQNIKNMEILKLFRMISNTFPHGANHSPPSLL